LELSSYQLELTEHLACAVAVILNLTPDHLDRHGGMAGYVQAKKRIFRNQGASDWAVVGVDDAQGQALVSELAQSRQVLPVAVGRALARGVYVTGGLLHDAIDGPGRQVADLRPIASLRGAHNWQNAAAAYAAVRALGLAPQAASAGLAHFAGLAHRMEQAGVVEGVRYVNDSKATNPEAAARALASFDRIFWIAGGRPKEGGLEPVFPFLDRVRHAYLIGEAAPRFAEALAGRAACSQCGDLATAFDQATEAARRDAGNEPVVLLTPACASFDQFTDFEARGEAFKALVAALGKPARTAGGRA
jgi:UDP-N-acetylmuramoylalanine--D-glutamate ligase